MTKHYDIVIAGAGLGGVTAAYRAAQNNKKVYLTEETDWLGGQLTSQAVPSDEHQWIEHTGCTKLYREFREQIRKHYKNDPSLKQEYKNAPEFNPGDGWVSKIAHEPKISLMLLTNLLQPYIDSGVIEYNTFTIPVSAKVTGDEIQSVTFKNTKTLQETTAVAKIFIDATEMGDLLPLTGCEYSIGAESKEQTNEPSAAIIEDRQDLQPITWVAALSLAKEGEEYKIAKPKEYDYIKNLGVPYDDNKILSWYIPEHNSKKKRLFSMFGDVDEAHPAGLWTYRRIINGEYFNDGRTDISLINWPQNDYIYGNIIENDNIEYHKNMARELTLSLVYWLQNEAPRADGGKGYAVKLRGDVVGTNDGLAKAPYIRESRRIIALNLIKENDVSKALSSGIKVLDDSVGIGHYAIDLHPTTKSGTFMYRDTYPFEIPLSSLIPIRLKNLIPACKNIGCTHLTNGCFRLHPVEWNVGEVAGLLSSYCFKNNIKPIDVYNNNLKEFQKLLLENGIMLHWPKIEL